MLLGAVRVALRRPYRFVVLALMLVIIGPLAAMRTPTDIFPEIRMPVIAVAWQYTGLPPDQMSGRISTLFQRSLTTTVNDIEHIEANTYPGMSIVKIFFQPGVDVAVANAQVTAVSQFMVRQMPPGTTPPMILNYNAATVPILQLALSGYARRTVCAIADFVAVLVRLDELGILASMRTYRPAEPVVKATAQYAKQTAHRSRGPDGSIFGNEAVLHLKSAAK
jgi:multidrug efflux pump subunit AcrB